MSGSILRIGRISIHAAREGGDFAVRWRQPPTLLFQSTPPVKAATRSGYDTEQSISISIHAAREGGDEVTFVKPCFLEISIHAAREGGDEAALASRKKQRNFNPRRP